MEWKTYLVILTQKDEDRFQEMYIYSFELTLRSYFALDVVNLL